MNPQRRKALAAAYIAERDKLDVNMIEVKNLEFNEGYLEPTYAIVYSVHSDGSESRFVSEDIALLDLIAFSWQA